jgi:hypothetical protein
MPSKNVVTWGASSVRSVIFSGGGLDIGRADELFLTAFNHQPSAYQTAPPGMPSGTSQASGVDKMGAVSLQTTPGRADLSVAPGQQQNQKLGAMFELVDLGGSLDLIQRASTALCERITKISRLGLILDLVKSASDNASAKTFLSEVLPFEIPLEDLVDISLQYTKRYKLSSLNDIEINVVYRWAVSPVQQFFLPAMGVSSITGPATTFYVASLNLDVNTVPAITEIDAARAETILREMRDKIDAVRRGGPIG